MQSRSPQIGVGITFYWCLLTSNKNGKFIFKTDDNMSGLSLKKDTYVTSWEIDLLPDEENKILYKYTVSGPDGVSFVASAEMTKI